MSVKRITLLLSAFLMVFALFACKKAAPKKDLVTLTGKVEVVSTHPSITSVPQNLRSAYMAPSILQEDGKRILLSSDGAIRQALLNSNGKTASVAGEYLGQSTYQGNPCESFSVENIKEIK